MQKLVWSCNSYQQNSSNPPQNQTHNHLNVEKHHSKTG
jgi:hypothetical protein